MYPKKEYPTLKSLRKFYDPSRVLRKFDLIQVTWAKSTELRSKAHVTALFHLSVNIKPHLAPFHASCLKWSCLLVVPAFQHFSSVKGAVFTNSWAPHRDVHPWYGRSPQQRAASEEADVLRESLFVTGHQIRRNDGHIRCVLTNLKGGGLTSLIVLYRRSL